jgi:hypothetical protein
VALLPELPTGRATAVTTDLRASERRDVGNRRQNAFKKAPAERHVEVASNKNLTSLQYYNKVRIQQGQELSSESGIPYFTHPLLSFFNYLYH